MAPRMGNPMCVNGSNDSSPVDRLGVLQIQLAVVKRRSVMADRDLDVTSIIFPP